MLNRAAGTSFGDGVSESTNGSAGAGPHEVLGGGRCLSWCKEKWWGMVIAVAEGTEGEVKVSLAPVGQVPVATPCKSFALMMQISDAIHFYQIISLPHPAPSVQLLVLTPPTASNPNASVSSTVGDATVTSLSWAPSCGRDYHLIATGTRGGVVRIWKVVVGESEDGQDNGEGWKAKLLTEFSDHG